MNEKTQSQRGGRPSKGNRELFEFRVPFELRDILLEAITEAQVSRSDYLARVAAVTHGFPVNRLPVADRNPSSNGLRSPFDLAGEPDADLAEAIAQLDAALTASGLTSGEFAAALGVQAAFLTACRQGVLVLPVSLHFRAMRVAAGLKQARARGWTSSFAAGVAIRDALRNDDQDWALDLCIKARDDLRTALGEDLPATAAWEAMPHESGFLEWDTLLGALVAHEFGERDLEPPAWSKPNRLSLKEDWVMFNPSLTESEVRAQTPRWLKSRRVYISRFDLPDP